MIQPQANKLYIGIFYPKMDNRHPVLLLCVGTTDTVTWAEWLCVNNLFNNRPLDEYGFAALLQFWLLLVASCPSIYPMPWLADKLLPFIADYAVMHFFTEDNKPDFELDVETKPSNRDDSEDGDPAEV